MKMKKIIEALPLLGSFSLLIIIALFFLSFAKAEAALQIDPNLVPPATLEQQPELDGTNDSTTNTATIPEESQSTTTVPTPTTSSHSVLQSNWPIILTAGISIILVITLTLISLKNSLWKK